MVRIAHSYRGTDETIPIDYSKAKYWFQKAHNKGDLGGTTGLGAICEHGG